MTTPPPSQIMAQRLQQFDDLRNLFPKRPPEPAHHVRIEELHEAMAVCNPAFKGRVSLSDLVEICRTLNGKLDERKPSAPVGEVTEDDARRLVSSLEENQHAYIKWDELYVDEADDYTPCVIIDGKWTIGAIQDALTAALRQAGDGWVKCSERYPENGAKVLIYVPGCYGGEHAVYRDEHPCPWQSFRDDNVMWSAAQVTHWRPLPPPPITEEHKP